MSFEIAGRSIGYGHTPIISAELGISHNADLDTALKMIDTAAECGADAIKVQYFKASDFVVDKGKTVTYKQLMTMAEKNPSGPPDDPAYWGDQFKEVTEPEYDFFKRHEIDIAFVEACYTRAREHSLLFGVTTTSAEGVRDIAHATHYWKVASDMLDKPDMIAEMRKTDLQIIVSTGHLPSNQVWKWSQYLLLHCVSEYPAKNPRLWNVTHMRAAGYTPGYSHHSQGIDACIRAAELGAVFLEVHFTLDKTMPGSDHWWSLDPKELRALSAAIK